MDNCIIDYNRAYSTMYYFLDAYWEKNPFEDLSILLGSMDPTLWDDGKPIDEAIIVDWEAITFKKTSITESDGFMYMIKFLEKQSNWLEFGDLINELNTSFNSKNENWQIWLNIFHSNI